eukprot:19802-Eustigmatos_ZCMA.PRE.1
MQTNAPHVSAVLAQSSLEGAPGSNGHQGIICPSCPTQAGPDAIKAATHIMRQGCPSAVARESFARFADRAIGTRGGVEGMEDHLDKDFPLSWWLFNRKGCGRSSPSCLHGKHLRVLQHLSLLTQSC